MAHSLERLEGRLLLSASQQVDVTKLSAGGCPLCGAGGCRHTTTAEGATLVACNFNVGNAASAAAQTQATVALAPLDQTFQLASRPSATKTIYLDFTGHTTTGTAWGNGQTIVTPEYNVDGQPGFSDQELSNIQNIWTRVVEDFSPFDVNVTTAEPSIDDLRKVGTGDSRWGIRVVIGTDTGNVAPGAGGVAYLGSFNWDSDTPTFVFPERLGNSNKNIAEATSHEVGHTLGLSHDGRSSPSEGYYYGHGSGATGWAPIMGVGYSREVVQWSKGEYANANNKQDDLGIIVGTVTNQYVPDGNGFGYRPDDYGSSVATAFQPVFAGGTTATVAGVIERSTDADVFEFTTAGRFTATISPATISPNLDVLAEIWSATGAVLHVGNPLATLSAAFDLTLAAGKYYLAVRGTGTGDPTTGYSEYGSLGQFTAQMTVEAPTLPVLSIAAAAAVHNEGNSGTTNFTFTVTRSGDTGGASSASWAVTGGGATPANADDFAGGVLPGGSVSFAAGENSKTITVGVRGDSAVEADEGFTVTLSSPTGAALGSPAQASGTIRNDDFPAVTIAADSADKPEGTGAGPTGFTFTVTRADGLTAASTVAWAVAGSGGNPADAVDFTGGVLPSGSVSFAVGESSKTITVNVSTDATIESDEGFTVTLSAPTGATLGSPAQASGTIRNDDFSAVTIAAAAADKAEGTGAGPTSFTFTVTRPTGATGAASVAWAVTGSGLNPANAADFAGGVLPSGSLAFTAGETSKTITVNVAADGVIEADEGFTVTLSAPAGATLGSPAQASGTIRNDDFPAVTIAADAGDKPEGTGPDPTVFTFTVTRQSGFAGSSSVAWAVAGSGPKPANAADFSGGVLPSGTVSFAAGETSKTITVNVAADTLTETDEGFTVTLSSPSGAALGVPAQAMGTIRNDDTGSRISIAAADAVKSEGDVGRTSFAFTLTRRGDLTGAVNVPWSIVGSGAYRADRFDFIGGVLPSGTIRLAAGRQTQTLVVNVLCDRIAEFDEEFTITLGTPLGGLDIVEPGLNSAAATIKNDDPGTPRPAPVTPAQGPPIATNQAIVAQAFATLSDTSGSSGTSTTKRIGAAPRLP